MTPAGDPERAELAARVAALVKEGRYEQAAGLAAEAGDLRRAIELYERVWRFAEAVPLAERLGDRALAVRLAIDGGDLATAHRVAAAVPGDARAELVAIGRAFAARQRFEDAASVLERAGDFAEAARLHQRAGNWIAAGRALELCGDLRGAAEAYERVLRSAPSSPVASALGEAETTRARLALGILLVRTGRPLDAVRLLQAAARHPLTQEDALAPLCAALLGVNLREAAAEIAERLAVLRPESPTIPEAIAAQVTTLASGAAPERFRVLRLLGAGAASRVYLAEDRLFGREVALKALTVGGAGAERAALRRFLREAEAVGRLRHPGVVSLLEIDAQGGLLVLEHLPGGTLADRLARETALPPGQVRRLALELLGALTAAHAAGIVHRDVKPSNVFFDAAGGAKLGDFGAAHLLDFGQTQTGGFIGTLAYLAPEQISGDRIGPAADLYALGVTLFEALTGRPPFLGPDLVAQHLGEAPPRASAFAPHLAPVHDAVLARALAKIPEDRFSSAAAMAEAVAVWPDDAGTGAPRSIAPSPAPVTPAPTPASRLEPVAELGPTARGRLRRMRDTRVGRIVLVEELAGPLGPDELEVVRTLAAAGGPMVQRVLALLEDERGFAGTIVYERVEGATATELELTPEERTALTTAVPDRARALAPRPLRFARTDTGLVLLVAPTTMSLP